ncbi:MAG TPA: di-heme oxidoredictase family protein [Kofleriaceae bacterium]
MGRRLAIAIAFVACASCGDNTPGEDLQGGDTTVDDRTDQAFTHYAKNLTTDEQYTFQAGKGPFDLQWETFQGLGPLYNDDQCFGCHGSNGRGRSQIGPESAREDINGPQSEALVRISLPASDGAPSTPGGDVPAGDFGLQLHDHATAGSPQVHIDLMWTELGGGTYGDGTAFSLRQPTPMITTVEEPLPADAMFSYRTAPRMIGLGLLDAIDDATIEALADPGDADGDGIAGHVNMVWDPIGAQTARGKFGWKANVPTLVAQASGAAFNDMGLTNKYVPDPMGGDPDVQDTQMDELAFMVATIAVPRAAPRDSAAIRGRALFDQFQCSSCHVVTLETGDSSVPELAHQTIHPYTDLLVHDMGPGLADNRPDYQASGTEWRTTPLWGLGLDQIVRDTVTYLHDGRARTLEEAILWHGGEAMGARESFRTAVKSDRDALIAFLNTL